jgi:hypothetical protein
MILRALFWISVVAILMPHEPDLGLGRPGVSAPTALLSRIENLVAPSQAAGALSANLPNITARSLEQVKAEIDEARREREARHNG